MINLEPELLVKHAFASTYDALSERHQQAAIKACRCVLAEDENEEALSLYLKSYENEDVVPAITVGEISRIRSAVDHARGVRELVIKLQEEHLEVAHVCSKILLYGFDDVSPVEPDKGTNRDRLHKELGDVALFEWLLLQEKLIDRDKIQDAMWSKLEVLPQWLKHFVISDSIKKAAARARRYFEELKASSERFRRVAARARANLTPKEREVLEARFGQGPSLGELIEGALPPPAEALIKGESSDE